MNKKPHYRLVTLGECHNGTRFYTKGTFSPMTLIVSSYRKNTILVHYGHDFDIRAKRIAWGYNFKGWVQV